MNLHLAFENLSDSLKVEPVAEAPAAAAEPAVEAPTVEEPAKEEAKAVRNPIKNPFTAN